ncbi:GDSL-type esterase/lipase family protein [Paenibacillus sp. TRM 82003]|nr:GDSL-type esterase/lipase family protein [Paenibacillus sp. TRM 82003]
MALHNVADLIAIDGSGSKHLFLSRLPDDVRTKLNPKAQTRAFNPGGVELRFNLESDEAYIELELAKIDAIEPGGIAELFHGDFQAHAEMTPQWIGAGRTRIRVRREERLVRIASERCPREAMRFDPELFRIVLPLNGAVRIASVEGSLSPPRPEQLPARRCLAYGSSITFGGDTSVPSGGYAAMAARQVGVDFFNLGLAGSCYLEEEMADYVASRDDWDFAVLELGINVIGFMDPEEYGSRVREMLGRISRRQPGKTVFAIDLITHHRDFSNNDPIAAEYRARMKQAVETVNAPNVVYIPGRTLLPSFDGLCVDLLHPSTAGMHEIASRLASAIRDNG